MKVKSMQIDEEMSITELQELMDENEKFLLGEIQKLKSQGKVEELMKGEKDADKI